MSSKRAWQCLPITQVAQILAQHPLSSIFHTDGAVYAFSLISRTVVLAVAPPDNESGYKGKEVAADIDCMTLDVARCPFRTVDLPRHRASDVPEGEDDADCGGALVRPCDVAAEPHPADRHRDEPLESCGAA